MLVAVSLNRVAIPLPTRRSERPWLASRARRSRSLAKRLSHHLDRDSREQGVSIAALSRSPTCKTLRLSDAPCPQPALLSEIHVGPPPPRSCAINSNCNASGLPARQRLGRSRPAACGPCRGASWIFYKDLHDFAVVAAGMTPSSRKPGTARTAHTDDSSRPDNPTQSAAAVICNDA